MAQAKKSEDKSVETKPKAEKIAKKTIAAEVTEEIVEPVVEPAKATKTAKAGKKSAKALEEVAEKEAKQERKASKQDEEEKPKQVQKPRVITYSKNQKAAREQVEAGKLYSITEALELLPKLSKTKFDATAEVHISLDIDPKQSDQNLRASAPLPAGTGKTVKIAVITGEKDAELAKKAGADSTSAEKILADIAKGKLDFDVLIASPDKMADLGRHAKVLGPKGLMPSPKSGTVTNNPAAMVEEIKKGRAEIKNDAQGIVHVAFGKLSFSTKDLESNLRVVLKAISANKPAGVKGVYVKTVYLTSSMSPSIKLDPLEAFKPAK